MRESKKIKWIGNFKKVKRSMSNIQLKVEIHRTKRKNSENYPYLNLLDKSNLIKWKIIPGRSYLYLHHRNERGRYGFHSQNKSAWKNSIGLNALLSEIEEHLLYED